MMHFLRVTNQAEGTARAEATPRRGAATLDSLVVRVAERGEVSVFLRKVCQPVNDSGQLRGGRGERTKGLRRRIA